MSVDLEYWHNKGEQDYPDFDPPDKAVLFELIEGNSDAEIAIMQAYRAGYQNAKEQVGD